MGKFKKFCIQTICPTNCQSIHIISSANRYCYDENYNLPQVQSQIRYKRDGVTHIVATGIIDHATHSGADNRDDTEKYEWEDNFESVSEILKREYHYTTAIKNTCIKLNIKYKVFIETLKTEIEEILL